MTQRIFTLVCLLLIVFHFNTSFAQDDLSLDDSFGSDAAVNTDTSSMAVPAETEELSLDSELEAASTPSTETSPQIANPLDSIVDGQTPTSGGNEDPFATMTASQNVDQYENVNLASPIELRQREGALYGFSVGLVIAAQPLTEDYSEANLSGGEAVSSRSIKRQTNPIQSVGFILRYAETPYYKIGTDINVSYTKSQNHSSITVKDNQKLGEVTTMKGEINLSYAIEMGALPVYFLGGLGFEKVTGNEVEKMVNSSGFGGQIGGGFVINSTINLEAMYAYYVHRLSNAMVEGYGTSIPKSVNMEEAKVINQGLILRGTFSFNY